MYVEKLIKDEFIEKLLNQTKELKVGDPLDEHTSLGPMMMPPMSPSSHIDKVSGYISRARNDSRCKLIYGGNIEGHFVSIVNTAVNSQCLILHYTLYV